MSHPETSVNYNGMVIIRLQVEFKKDNIYWKWTTFALTGVWLFMLFIKLQNCSLYISCSPANRHAGVNLNLTFTGLNSNLSKEMKQKPSTSFKFYTFEWKTVDLIRFSFQLKLIPNKDILMFWNGEFKIYFDQSRLLSANCYLKSISSSC